MHLKLIVVLLVAAVAGMAQAVPIDIRIDFSDAAVVAVPNWNTFSAVQSDVPVVDFNTGLTDHGITASLVILKNVLNKGTTTTHWNMAHPGPAWLDPDKNAAKDHFISSWNSLSEINFKNLPLDLTYEIEVISSHSGNQNTATWKVIGAITQTTTFNPKTQGYDNGQWLTWTDISPDGTGKIAVQVGSTSSNNYNNVINAVRLYAVPEPTTMTLLALGGLAFFRRRRA